MMKRVAGTGLLLLSLSAWAAGAEDAPGWLKQAAAVTLPAYDKRVTAAVLLNDSRVSVEPDGKVVRANYYAVKVLSREGRQEAIARAVYATDSEEVKEFQAWLIRPSGEVKKYGKDRILDAAVVNNDVYNELRAKLIVGVDDAEPGSIFGFWSLKQEKSFVTQDEKNFQEGGLPVVISRITYALPPGWHAEAITFNHEKIEPVINGSTYTWELQNLAPIADEPASPDLTSLTPRLAINYFPPAEGKAPDVKSFDNWAAVSSWVSQLSDPQSEPDQAITAKARELTAGANNEMEKIAAIGRFVQTIQYISIQIGLGRGGGVKPHAASEVFSKSYGDCKDKSNLMRAMLKAVGITSYPVAIFSGDPTYVHPEWASPQQFNHCIIAVQTKEDSKAPVIVEHPSLGKLLIFDPTDEDTPVGDLPDHEQGSYALIVAGASGKLMRMPVTPPENNALLRSITAALSPDGTITADVKEDATGQPAVYARREFQHLSREDYKKSIERWVSHGASGAAVSVIQPTDERSRGRFSLVVKFSAERYGQLMQDRLLVFKPAIVSRRERLSFTETKRKYPVMLDAQGFHEETHIKLPAGFAVDEMPDAAKLETSFGSYSITYEVKGGELICVRNLSVRSGLVPAEQYSSVRDFFKRVLAAEQAPVVLVRN